MDFINKYSRFMRNTGPARFFVPLGIILTVFGIILMGMKTDNYLKTAGTVTSVTEGDVNEAADETRLFDVAVEYTVEGKQYDGIFEDLAGEFKKGDSIDVYYDPADPGKITNSQMNGLIPIVMIGAGAAAIIFGVWSAVKAFKKSKALDEAASGGGQFPREAFAEYKTSAGVTEYYFKFDGHSLKPGYLIEDANRNVLFEGKMLKNALVGNRTFEFNNHVTGSVKEHEVGHTVTSSFNDELFSAKSRFKFDGKDIWDLIHGRGIRIATDLFGKFPYMKYDVAKDGVPFARVENTSVYVHEDEEAEHKLVIPTGRMYYRIWSNSKDLELIFLTVFAISETEQTVVE